ncbi:hypothetical protein BMT54_07535 [Pasteurellaceae bacterium 15-036681]|nr:hypothetical protein BMT54_07535 [Pasteurellaceae bacterium 15-036681]
MRIRNAVSYNICRFYLEIIRIVPTFDVAIGDLSPQENITPAVQKGNKALLDFVNKEIAELKASGKLKAAYQKALVPVYGENEAILAK